MIERNSILQGDCLELLPNIKSGSVDLVLIDPPYGNMDTDGGRKLGINGWDKTISPKEIFEHSNRILRKNGKLIVFSQEPYTSELITSAIPNLPFGYRAVWIKDNFANALGVNKNMVSFFEDILIFTKMNPKCDNTGENPAREYLRNERQKVKDAGYTDKDLRIMCGVSLKGGGLLGHYWGKGQWIFPTRKHYTSLQQTGFFKKPYEELEEIAIPYRLNINKELNELYPFTFNLWEGNKYKSNVLQYKKDYEGLHPTQKPVALIKDLIQTYTNEGNLVVDFTAGSMTTAIGCIDTNRDFIVMEKDEHNFNVGKQRVENYIDSLLAQED